MSDLIKMRADWIPGTDTYAVYAYARQAEGKWAAITIEDGNLVFTVLPEGVVGEPTMRVPSMFLTAFREALNQLGPFSDSPVDWLRDAVKTRDRLMTLVERMAGGEA